MQRILLACLGAAAIVAGATTARAQASATATAAYDPIGQIIGAVKEGELENATSWGLKATIYHLGNGMSTHDSLGCKVVPLRTAAIDRAIVSRGSILFIKETVGMRLPDGSLHDGYWYASDTGRLIQGERIDLFSGANEASMAPLYPVNLKTLTVVKVGEFDGCPPEDGGVGARMATAAARTSADVYPTLVSFR